MIHPIPFTGHDLIDATGGELLCGNRDDIFSGISIDSRDIQPGELYVAIIGETHDGHSFINDTLGRGVNGLIVDKNHADEFLSLRSMDRDVSCVAVEDTTKALGKLAFFQRKRAGVTVTAITGSSGKTTTRTMISRVVEQKFSILSTIGNFNNEIGLPLTLLRLGENHEQAVVELGMNHSGEITKLAKICQPEIGVITNIGPAHLEGLGSIEGIMNAKGELLAEIKPGGTAILNADDSRVLKLSERRNEKILFYGFSEKADIQGASLRITGNKTKFLIRFPETEIQVILNACGDFNVSNALSAAAVGYSLGLSPAEIRDGIEAFQPIKGRMNIISTKSGITIVDDTYNANPDSVKCAITAFQSLRKEGRGILVLGDMFELGNESKKLHQEIGGFVAESGITSLYVTGNYAETVAKGAKGNKMDEKQIFIGVVDDIILQLKESLVLGDWLLVKGSRAMKMERIIEGLKETVMNKRN
jgi:UDP-N-acetylmuramoyl-tripeptide--D-alanyl-D-alanine ligase